MREEWNKLWEVLVVCWSTDPLDRPTASELEAMLRMILQPRFSFLVAEGCRDVANDGNLALLPDPNNGTALAKSDMRGNLGEKVF
jgi:hypothetical protein